MWTIRDAQMESLRRASRRTFEDHAVDRCKTSGVTVGGIGSEDFIRRYVQQGIQRALGYGIREENHILRFIDMMPALGVLGDGTPSEPWVLEILTDTELNPAVKITLLEQRVRKGKAGAGAP